MHPHLEWLAVGATVRNGIVVSGPPLAFSLVGVEANCAPGHRKKDVPPRRHPFAYLLRPQKRFRGVPGAVIGVEQGGQHGVHDERVTQALLSLDLFCDNSDARMAQRRTTAEGVETFSQ